MVEGVLAGWLALRKHMMEKLRCARRGLTKLGAVRQHEWLAVYRAERASTSRYDFAAEDESGGNEDYDL